MAHKNPLKLGRFWCCEEHCDKDATYLLFLNNALPDDYTHVCNDHIDFGIELLDNGKNSITIERLID